MNSHRTRTKVEAQKVRTPSPLVKLGGDTPPVHRIPIALARRFFQVCTTAAAQSLEGHELTPLEWGVLRYLNRVNGEPDIDQIGLAERIGIDRNTAGQLVERLERRRLLERHVNGEDRRSRLLRLTERGEKLHAQIVLKTYGGQMELLDVLEPGERDLFLDLLVRVIEGNRKLAKPGSGRRKRMQGQPLDIKFR